MVQVFRQKGFRTDLQFADDDIPNQLAQLENMVLRAPFTGTVTQKLSEVGETVSPGSAGGANAINMWFDRDIDDRMTRTRLRPIPAGRLSPAAARWLVPGLLLAGLLVAAGLPLGFLPYLAGYAAATTVLCLLIGYPFAYFMARSSTSLQPLLLMGVMLPFWTSFLLRVYAWKALLDADTGWVGTALKALHIDQLLYAVGAIPAEGQFMYSPFSLVIGMVYTYLPFMVLPLFGTLSKLDIRLLEAAQDLGATPWQTFWRVTVPSPVRCWSSSPAWANTSSPNCWADRRRS